MSEISEAAKVKACELLRGVDPRGVGRDGYGTLAAWIPNTFARFIQEVSDAAEEAQGDQGYHSRLAPFILPKPVDGVDALDEIIRTRYQWHNAGRHVADELAERGFKIVPVQS